MLDQTHWTIWLCYAVIIWLVKVGHRDPLVLALLGAWAVAEVFVRVTSLPLPLGLYFFLDAAVISIVMADARPLTRAVIGIYLIAWASYVFIEPDRLQWYVLWALSMTQFLLAGLQCHLGVQRHGMGRLGADGRPLGGGGAYPMAIHFPSAKAHQHAAGHAEYGKAAAVERRP
jgi:hypothetical protein